MDQNLFVSTVMSFMYTGVLDHRFIRRTIDLNQIREFAFQIRLYSLLDILPRSRPVVLSAQESTSIITRFNSTYSDCIRKRIGIDSTSSFDDHPSSESLSQENSNTIPPSFFSLTHSSSNHVNSEQLIIDSHFSMSVFDCSLWSNGRTIPMNKFLMSEYSEYFVLLLAEQQDKFNACIRDFDSYDYKRTVNVYLDMIPFETLMIVANFIYFHRIIKPDNFTIQDWIHLAEAAQFLAIKYLLKYIELEMIRLIDETCVWQLFQASYILSFENLSLHCGFFLSFRIYKSGKVYRQISYLHEDYFEEMIVRTEEMLYTNRFVVAQHHVQLGNELQPEDQILEREELERVQLIDEGVHLFSHRSLENHRKNMRKLYNSKISFIPFTEKKNKSQQKSENICTTYSQRHTIPSIGIHSSANDHSYRDFNEYTHSESQTQSMNRIGLGWNYLRNPGFEQNFPRSLAPHQEQQQFEVISQQELEDSYNYLVDRFSLKKNRNNHPTQILKNTLSSFSMEIEQ